MPKSRPTSVYSRQCPVCKRFNLPDSSECWNCHYSFPRFKQKKTRVLTGAKKALIVLIILLVLIIVVLRFIIA